MTEYMHLVGAEQVQSAANRMVSAAEEMRRAVGSMDDSLARHQRFMDDWLQRLESAMENNAEATKGAAEALASLPGLLARIAVELSRVGAKL